MLFRGSYEVTRELKGQDLTVTNQAELKNTNVAGTLTVQPAQTIDFKNNKVTNLGAPSVATDASTKQYVDTNTRTVHIGINTPSPSLGQNQDLYFRGTLGGKRQLSGITGGNVTDISSDGETVLITTDSGQGKYYYTTDAGVSWQIGTAIADVNKFRYVVSPNKGKFVIIRTQVGTGVAPPLYTLNSGTSWQTSTVPANTPANVNHIVFDKDNANENLVMLLASGAPLYSPDAGITWLETDAPAGNYTLGAMFGNVAVITTSTGACYRSEDYGKTYTAQGTIPAISVSWKIMTAVNLTTFIAAGTGSGSNKFAFSYDAGATWTTVQVAVPLLQVVDMIVNRITGVISAVGDTGIVAFSQVYDVENWNIGSTDDPSHVSRDIDTYGSGFIGVSFGESPLVALTPRGEEWSVNIPASFSELYTKQTAKWVSLDALQKQQADSLYLSASGGIINGNLGMNNHNISNVADPVNNQDAVNKQYLDQQLQLTGGEVINVTISNTNTEIDVVSPLVETFKYIISAKKGTSRYYSELNIIANGVLDPASTEYAVMSMGGLDLTISVTKGAGGDTILSIQSSETDTELYIKRVLVDF